METKAESGRRRGEERGLRGKERGGRECRRAEANEKQLTSFSCRGKNINKCEGAEANEIQLIFFPFSDEIKEIERTNTSNQGAKICFVWEKNSLRVPFITVAMNQGQC